MTPLLASRSDAFASLMGACADSALRDTGLSGSIMLSATGFTSWSTSLSAAGREVSEADVANAVDVLYRSRLYTTLLHVFDAFTPPAPPASGPQLELGFLPAHAIPPEQRVPRRGQRSLTVSIGVHAGAALDGPGGQHSPLYVAAGTWLHTRQAIKAATDFAFGGASTTSATYHHHVPIGDQTTRTRKLTLSHEGVAWTRRQRVDDGEGHVLRIQAYSEAIVNNSADKYTLSAKSTQTGSTAKRVSAMEGVLHAQLAVATQVAQSGGQARVEVAVQVFVSPTEKIDGELLRAAIVPAATRVLDAHVLRLVALPAAAASQAFAAGAAGLFTIGRLAAQGCEGGSNPAARAQPKRVLGVASRGLRFSMWGIRDADSACQPFSHVLGDDRTAVFELLRASGAVARMAASVASAASGGGASTAPASASDGPLAILLTRERAALTDPERGQLLVNHYWDCKGLAVWRVTSRDDAAALQKRVVAGCLAAAPYSSGAVSRGGGGAAVVGVLVEHPSAVPIGGALGNGGSGAPADGGGDGDSGEVASGGHAEDAAAAPTAAAVKRGRGRPSKAASAASAAVAAAAAAVAEEEEEAAATASSSSVRGALNRAARNSGRNSRRPAPYREPPLPPPPSASAGGETAASSAPGISAAAGGGGGKSLPVPSAVGGGGAVAGGGGGGDGIWGPLSSAVDGAAGGDGFDDHGLDVLSGRVGGSGAGAGARGRRSSDRGGGRSSSGSAGSITTSTAAASLATPYFAVSIGINTPISSSDDDGNGEACSASSDDDVELLEVMPIDGVSPVCLATAVESISRSGVSAPSLASVSSTVPQPVTLTASHRPPSVPAPLAGNTRAAAPLLSTASTVALQSAPPPLWRGGEVIRAPKQVGTYVAVPSGIYSDSGLPPLHQPLSGPRVPPATLRASTTTTAAVTFASSVRPDEAALSTSGVLSSAGGRSGGGGSGGADNTNITAVSAHISAAVPSGGATMSLPVSMGASGRAPEAIATLRSTAAPVPTPLPSGKQPAATAFSAQPALLLQRAGRGSGAAVRKQQPGLGAALPLVSCLPSSIPPGHWALPPLPLPYFP